MYRFTMVNPEKTEYCQASRVFPWSIGGLGLMEAEGGDGSSLVSASFDCLIGGTASRALVFEVMSPIDAPHGYCSQHVSGRVLLTAPCVFFWGWALTALIWLNLANDDNEEYTISLRIEPERKAVEPCVHLLGRFHPSYMDQQKSGRIFPPFV